MFWRLVGRVVGSEWRTFCGCAPERFLALATDALDDLGYEYDVAEIETTAGERTLLGAEETGDRIDVSSPADFEVEVVRATSSPLTRVALSVVLTSEQRADATGDLSVVTIRRLDDENREHVARFVAGVVDESDRRPWDVSHHVGFRLAVLLRYKVKVLWTYWLRRANAAAD